MNYPVGKDSYESRLLTLKEHFHIPLFEMLQERGSSRMTAYEVGERMSEKVGSLAALNSEFEEDYLDQVNEKQYGYNVSYGVLEPAPQSLQRQGREIAFNYLSPLSMAMKRIGEGQGISRALNELQIAFNVAPDKTLAAINWPGLVKKTFELHGTPFEVLMSDREIKAQLEESARKMAEAQASQQLKNAGGMSAVNETAEPGSMGELMAEQMMQQAQSGMA